ncbi:hypothetical protein ACO0LF_15555 [Undibacterium sp. Di27W]|uniref:hypothetical protein n=1 Tax=Undibacterium sp. Di27W TaxID=3413036 RepID=UPI003BF0DCB4
MIFDFINLEFHGKFDFLRSSCAFEHLGSIEHGKEFGYNAMHWLKPGGHTVHTTKFNLSSNEETLETVDAVLYRKRDIADIITALRAQGHHIEMN